MFQVEFVSTSRRAVDSSRQNCSTDKSYETDDDDDKETQYRLDPK
jgi:hypothetical protein